MAMKANASSNSNGGEFKKFVGVGSFRVLGVNPSKAELEKFFGRELDKEPEYLVTKKDARDNDKEYKQLRVSYMIQADLKDSLGKEIKTNSKLEEPLKTTVNFFIDSRYNYNSDKSKVQVIDKYGRTAWVTIEQAQNHQIPVYKNGPAKIDPAYRPAYVGEEALLKFITDYLNVTPIETMNRNTGEWITNPHPEDCEAGLYEIKKYFNGDIKELKEHCAMMPDNRLKLLVGVRTDNEGRQHLTVYTRATLKNGAKSYNFLKDSVEGNAEYLKDTVFTDDPAGVITDIHEYKETATPTNLAEDPFKANANDLPFGESSDDSDDPFANM